MSHDAARAVWVVCGDDPAQLASYRYVALIPAMTLGARVLGFEPDDNPTAFLDRHAPSALVLGKAFHPGFAALAAAARARGIPVLAAMCDAHFDDQVNIALSRLASRIVVPNQMMADAVRQHFGVIPAVIEDPYEGPRGMPRFAPGEVIRLLWFGHAANHDTIVPGITQLGSGVRRNLHITILTNQPERLPPLLARLPRMKAAIGVDLHDWSLDRQWREIAACDAVMLPSNLRLDKAVRGHNRLVQTIHARRLALAYTLPAYRELEAFCWCGRDLGAGLGWALAHQAEAEQRIAAGQAHIDIRFSPPRIAARWQEEIGLATQAAAAGAAV